MAEQAPGYIFNAFVFTYGTQVLGASRHLLLTGLIVTTMLGFIWAPIAGAVSDRIGRRQMYIIGCVFVAIFTFAYFAMLDTRIPWVMFTAVALSFIPVMTMYGPEAALIAEAFPPRLRYSGASRSAWLPLRPNCTRMPCVSIRALWHRAGTTMSLRGSMPEAGDDQVFWKRRGARAVPVPLSSQR